MRNLISWLKNEESGQGMVEYGLIIGLVAIALVIALGTLTDSLDGIFGRISTALNAAGTEPPAGD
jgi:pilus assembly protein Flp/PilA